MVGCFSVVGVVVLFLGVLAPGGAGEAWRLHLGMFGCVRFSVVVSLITVVTTTGD